MYHVAPFSLLTSPVKIMGLPKSKVTVKSVKLINCRLDIIAEITTTKKQSKVTIVMSGYIRIILFLKKFENVSLDSLNLL